LIFLRDWTFVGDARAAGDFIRSIAVAGAAALLLATSGAFDTGTRPLRERLIYG
jgi:hypothetical protein